MGRDRWQVPRHEEFPACPDRQADRDQRLEPNGTPYPPTLLGGPNQSHEVGNGLWAEGRCPGRAYVSVGIQDRIGSLVEVGLDPGPWLSRPSWSGRLWTRRTRDWRGG